MPTIVEVVERSGHKTLRIIIAETASDDEKRQFLGSLEGIAVNYEQANERFIALDVRLEADYLAVCDWLWRLQQHGWLEYETGATQDDQ